MNIERITHRSFRMNLLVVFVLSGMVVTLASLVGRGALNLQGALFADEPTEVTVIRLIEPYEIIPKAIYTLPKRNDDEFRYSIETTEDEVYFVRISSNGPPWELVTKPELLRQ